MPTASELSHSRWKAPPNRCISVLGCKAGRPTKSVRIEQINRICGKTSWVSNGRVNRIRSIRPHIRGVKNVILRY